MQSNNYFKSNYLLYISAIIILLSACKKESFNPGIPAGTRFATLTVNGFALDSLQVRIGPRSVVAGYLFEDISANSFEVPFDTAQTTNRVVLYAKDGSVPYPGSQFRFENKYSDTAVNVLFDGKTIEYNPVLRKPAAGKMGLRISFKSIASGYKGPVDIELHERYIDSRGDIVIRSNYQLIRNVKSTELSPYTEINPPVSGPDFLDYIFYVRVAGTTNPLTYPQGVAVTPFESFPFMPDYTSIITINDIRLVIETPNRIIYSVTDHSGLFPQGG